MLTPSVTMTALTIACRLGMTSAAKLDQLMPFLLETRLRELGGRFIVQPDWSDHVERDGNLITGQNPQSSRSIARSIIEALA